MNNRNFRTSNALVSIVAPAFNEANAIQPYLNAVFAVAAEHHLTVEVVIVDDGSRDQTAAIAADAAIRDPRVRLVALSRNFGKEAALTAGIDYARGAAVIPMDVDLQDPPELIPHFVRLWTEGFDVVFGRRIARPDDTWGKRNTAALFYTIYNRIADHPIPDNVGDFRLMDRKVIEALGGFREKNRFMKGLFGTLGFRTTGVDYVRPQRTLGTTKWSFWKLWNFALDGLISFSTVPLRVWTYLGFVIAISGLAYAAFIVVKTIFLGIDVPGYASLMTAILIMGGIQLISLGVIGEYIGRMFIETKNRPIYLVREVIEQPVSGDASAQRRPPPRASS